MSRTATATLHSPWDCKWSRFGRVHASSPTAPAESLWVCVYPDGSTRRAIDVAECATCPHWEFDPPAVANEAQAVPAVVRTDAAASAVVCACRARTERRLEIGVRITALLLAFIFAATGFVILTRPLAIPLTIALWLCAASSFLLGIWGNFNRESLPTRSW